jgi:hypothetical protein
MAYQKLQTERGLPVVKSDTLNIPSVNGSEVAGACVLYTGTGGVIRVLTAGGDDITLVSVPAGVVLPIQVIRVFATTTTATGIIALW